MTSPRRSVRAFWFATIVLQMAMPSAAALVDAKPSALSDGPQRPWHFESHSTAACGHEHSLDCPYCQFLSSLTPPPPHREPAFPTAEIVFAARPLELGRIVARPALPHQPRAPPFTS
jgi:hypothetical protein